MLTYVLRDAIPSSSFKEQQKLFQVSAIIYNFFQLNYQKSEDCKYCKYHRGEYQQSTTYIGRFNSIRFHIFVRIRNFRGTKSYFSIIQLYYVYFCCVAYLYTEKEFEYYIPHI